MQTKRWAPVVAGAVGLSALVIAMSAGRGGGQGTPPAADLYKAASVTAQPVDGGKLCLYVVDETKQIVTVLEDGVLAASYQLPEKDQHHQHTLVTGRSEPADGGQAYCFVIDQANGAVYTFRDAKYVGSQPLPDTGQKM